MATKIKEIDSYKSSYHFKIGIIFCALLFLFLFISKNINKNNTVPFVATFNYIEGVYNETDVKIAGIKVGNVQDVKISSDGVIVYGYIEKKYNIPKDSIIKIKSDGIFGKKSLSIEAGFGEYFNKSSNKYVFNQTQDSYSIDMFLRYLNNLNE